MTVTRGTLGPAKEVRAEPISSPWHFSHVLQGLQGSSLTVGLWCGMAAYGLYDHHVAIVNLDNMAQTIRVTVRRFADNNSLHTDLVRGEGRGRGGDGVEGVDTCSGSLFQTQQ